MRRPAAEYIFLVCFGPTPDSGSIPSHTQPRQDHAPNFPLKHAQKDLAFSLALAGQLGVEAKTAAAANGEMADSACVGSPKLPDDGPRAFVILPHTPEFYEKALAAGDGELDFSAVARAVEAAAKSK